MPDDPRTTAAMLARFRTALLATRGEDGHLRCRPMAMRQAVRGEEIWFATARDSTKVRDLEHDPRCALVFFDPTDGTTVSLSGTGEVILDRKLMTELWDPSWTRWFPGGPEPKDVALLRVIPEHVERHDGASGRTEVLFEGKARAKRR
jgi:general stress protein 26